MLIKLMMQIKNSEDRHNSYQTQNVFDKKPTYPKDG